MARLIDADAMLEYLNLMYDKQNDSNEPFNCAVLGAINYIKHKAPTIDAVSVVHGEWIKHKDRTVISGEFIDFFPAEYECSNCGLREAHYFINSKPHNYCPNCGAKMKGADDE